MLSAHGVAPSVVAQARAQGLDILDVTCPFVTKVHRTAKQLYDQGYQVLLVGDQGHTEVKGIVGAVEAMGGKVTVISTADEVRALQAEARLSKKVGLVSQTTQRSGNFGEIVGEVAKTAVDVRAVNTICNATDELQDAAVRLARQTEVVIVVGGRKSANTRRLRQSVRGAGRSCLPHRNCGGDRTRVAGKQNGHRPHGGRVHARLDHRRRGPRPQ